MIGFIRTLSSPGAFSPSTEASRDQDISGRFLGRFLSTDIPPLGWSATEERTGVLFARCACKQDVFGHCGTCLMDWLPGWLRGDEQLTAPVSCSGVLSRGVEERVHIDVHSVNTTQTLLCGGNKPNTRCVGHTQTSKTIQSCIPPATAYILASSVCALYMFRYVDTGPAVNNTSSVDRAKGSSPTKSLKPRAAVC